MLNNIDELIELIRSNWDWTKAHIYPIKLKQNQSDDLGLYLRILQQMLKVRINPPKKKKEEDKEKDKVKGYKGKQGKKKKKELQKDLPLFEGCTLDDVCIQEIDDRRDVRQITLDIYMHSLQDKNRPEFKVYIYIVTSITDLS